jgi:hypothetical protein
MSFAKDWRTEGMPSAMELTQPSAPQPAPQYLPPTPTLGAIGVDSTARWFGTDRKTFLLLVGTGLVGGVLLHILGLKVAMAGRRARTRVKKLATPRNLAIAGVAAAGLGAAWWYYSRHSGPAGNAQILPPRKPVTTQRQLAQKVS